MLKTERIMKDDRYRDFEEIRKAKLLMNEHKTMNVSAKQIFDKLREESREVVMAWYKWRSGESKLRAKNFADFLLENEVRLDKEAFEAELADLANMCYLIYLNINDYKEKLSEENKD